VRSTTGFLLVIVLVGMGVLGYMFWKNYKQPLDTKPADIPAVETTLSFHKVIA